MSLVEVILNMQTQNQFASARIALRNPLAQRITNAGRGLSLNPMNTTKQQVASAVNATLALAEAIRQLKQVPAGTLYAQLMPVMDLDQFNALIRILVNAGLVRQDQSHLLTWIGPVIEPATLSR